MGYWKNKQLKNLTEIVDGVPVIEEWKDIPGWEGAYQVSSFGRVKSLPRTFIAKDNHVWVVKEKIRSQSFDGDGYLQVYLSVRQYRKMVKPHRFVAKLFVPNPDNKPTVNHKKGVKVDNMAWALEWCTHSENEKHSYDVLGKKPKNSMLGKFGAFHHRSRRIRCNTLDIEFHGIMEAARQLGLNAGNIGAVLKKERVATMGFVFSYV